MIDWEARDFVEAEKRTFASFCENRGEEREPSTGDAWMLRQDAMVLGDVMMLYI